MAYQVTARKWRPQRFYEVVGQQHITTTLTNALHSGRVAQCYLFTGPRGVGKTTTARILAKALNCANRGDTPDPCGECPSCRAITDGTSMDVLEIDGASNNSVDDVRELREIVRYIPTEGAYKVYIIDEVHMLSTAAFNALLKTLEEPPERVVFVFATTEVQEVPETILSRCQRFNFRRIPTSLIASHLGKITTDEGIDAEQEALYLLAHRADGALRDAESLLDQVVSFSGGVSATGVSDVLGLVDRAVFFDAARAIAAGDGACLLDLVAAVIDGGGDIEEFVRGFVEHASHMLFTKVQGSADKLEVADTERARYDESVGDLAEEDLLRIVQALMELEADLRRSLQPRFRTELALVRLAHMGRAVDVGRLLTRLAALEAAVGSGRQRQLAAAHTPAAAPASTGPAPAPASQPRPQAADSPPPPVPPPQREEGPGAEPSAVSEQKTPPSGPIDTDELKGQWSRVTHLVRQTQPSAGTFLQEVTRMELEGVILTLFFSQENRFGMGLVGKAHEAVSAAIAQVTNHQLRIRCSLDEGDGGSGGQGPEPPLPPPATDNPEQRPAPEATTPPAQQTGRGADLDPSVRAVVDAIDGELV
ncbi:MAG: DNA polymerase III subunit gamma/tau [Candidatus Latescibacteria bacterium]|jgi:DNA polymerase-3 subunit gamma/tau|nr:DNA polymerase III subunit gamma/tau [Gemmatimonadaceae bacterium]MDP6014757.1 DNA polymerase III subunit gamma/tau [Candidatus Latescibacterota bacterium]MDP7447998.1 DNA polymerase III subunit gamma/tau [Candidatus Latescibacterota bacterium]HJP29765.1 DNA polymerase III subunit gamma/tau [Candidatus Latescibacterota bacterium]